MPGRDDFDLAPGEIYLDGAYCAPLPRAARAAVAAAYALKAEPYRIGPDEFFGYPDAVRERLARVLRVPQDEVGVTTSTTLGATLLAQGIRWRPGDRVLIGPDEFPSNVYAWQALAERGVRVAFVGERGRPLTAADLEAALAGGPVRLLAVAALHYLTGDLYPLAEFARLLHAQGGLLVVDATQAAGCVDHEWSALGPDAVITSGYKWLLGPYGTGAVWVRRALLGELANVNCNWWSTAKARDFQRVLDYSGFPVHGRTLDSGEPASFLNMGAFRAGLDHLLGVGVAATEAHHRRLQDRLIAAVAGTALRPLTRLDGSHRGPILYFEVAGGAGLDRLHAELAGAHVRVSLRSGRLRVSPGLWNDESDVDAFAAAVRRALG